MRSIHGSPDTGSPFSLKALYNFVEKGKKVIALMEKEVISGTSIQQARRVSHINTRPKTIPQVVFSFKPENALAKTFKSPSSSANIKQTFHDIRADLKLVGERSSKISIQKSLVSTAAETTPKISV